MAAFFRIGLGGHPPAIATLTFVDWFNQRRLHSEFGDIPPAEFEHDYYGRTRTETPVPTPTRT